MDPVQSLLKNSFAITDANAALAGAAAGVCSAAWEFFRSPLSAKEAYTTAAGEGFRAFATEYTDEPHQTDLVECFSCSITRRYVRSKFPPGPGLLLYDAMLDVQRLFASETERLAREVLLALGLHPPPCLGFERWSRLQVNYADMAIAGRDLLHVVHEDGDLLTLDFATGPGLKVLRHDGTPQKLWPESAGKFVVLTGEILSIVSGGRIGAAYHCVERQTNLDERLALLYFADADPDLLGQCTDCDANAIRDRITAGWLRSGVAPVQPSVAACDAEEAS